MKKNKKYVLLPMLIILIFLFYGINNLINNNNVSRVFHLEEHVKSISIDGTQYAVHRLSNNGEMYLSNPLSNPAEYSFGRGIGKTTDGMLIYEVKNDTTTIIMKGFMFPGIVFKKEDSSD